MTIQLNDEILIINEQQIKVKDINSITKVKNIIFVKTKRSKLEFVLTPKAAQQAMNVIEHVLAENKNFIRCDNTTILNLENLESLIIKQTSDGDYAAKSNFGV